MTRGREDRLSDLPGNVIDLILERLPAPDAARTNILSRKWRYAWATLPQVVLDWHFWNSFSVKCPSFFKQTIDEILLHHVGDLGKFVLYVPRGLSDKDVDRWMLYVTRNGVKELTITVNTMSFYKLPSSVFNCPNLTHLDLCRCDLKPPNSFVGFQSLRTCRLKEITFVPTQEFYFINVPLLVSLDLIQCCGTQYLQIVSPQLESLGVTDNHHLLLNCFMNCKNLRVLKVRTFHVNDDLEHDEKTTLEKLLCSLAPILEKLYLDPAFLEVLSASAVSKGVPFMLNSLRHLSLRIDFCKLNQTSGALQLIKSAPNLSKLQISVYAGDNGEGVLKYLNTPACLDTSLSKLEYIVFKSFECTEAELLLVKLLFARTPSLLRMCIEQDPDVGSIKLIELMRFPRASPRAELFYVPTSD